MGEVELKNKKLLTLGQRLRRKKNRFGYWPNPHDARDWDYANIEPDKIDLPAMVDYFDRLPRVLYQESAPSCVGHGVAHQIWLEEIIRGFQKTVPSRGFIWAISRLQHQTSLKNTGTYPRLAYNGVSKIGCPGEKYWPYNDSKKYAKTKPGYDARRHASSRQGLKYYTITHNKSQRIRQALSDGHPVGFGTQVTDQFYHTGQVMRPDENESLLGGHFVCLVGYRHDHFIAVNSWKGRERLLFHESWIEWENSRDFTVVDGWKGLKK